MLRWIRRPGWYAAGTTLGALVAGLLVFAVVRGSMLPEDPGTLSSLEAVRLSLVMFGDLLFGLLAVAILPFALRPWADALFSAPVAPAAGFDAGPEAQGAPAAGSAATTARPGVDSGWALAAGVAVIATATVSSLAAPAQVIVLVSFAARRRPWWFGVAAGVFLAAAVLNASVAEPDPSASVWMVLLLAVAVCGVCWLVGSVRRGRRALIRSLRQEAVTARREREAHAEQVRAAERTRIAREMHDSLSHRLSLISLHAGALEYRTDLDAETLHRTAGLVRETARTASRELRTVLSVLREEDHPASPDATLAALEGLVATTRELGTPVEFTTSGLLEADDGEALPEVVSRAVFRFGQECLTNARTHAPHGPVRLTLTGVRGEGITLIASNPVPAHAVSDGSGGYGLIGLRERFELLDGSVRVQAAAGSFTVEAWLPWQR
ncbi:histidine kinase [Citricoccus sp.]|uniref:sensor histidine kinase n=1 Tax=Citricoccus sp. TaxID=1978372 RepID=UPI0028BE0D44|nr:histidine kinase [Citricoccus sp.]